MGVRKEHRDLMAWREWGCTHMQALTGNENFTGTDPKHTLTHIHVHIHTGTRTFTDPHTRMSHKHTHVL